MLVCAACVSVCAREFSFSPLRAFSLDLTYVIRSVQSSGVSPVYCHTVHVARRVSDYQPNTPQSQASQHTRHSTHHSPQRYRSTSRDVTSYTIHIQCSGECGLWRMLSISASICNKFTQLITGHCTLVNTTRCRQVFEHTVM